jgi:hypothetical protein
MKMLALAGSVFGFLDGPLAAEPKSLTAYNLENVHGLLAMHGKYPYFELIRPNKGKVYEIDLSKVDWAEKNLPPLLPKR